MNEKVVGFIERPCLTWSLTFYLRRSMMRYVWLLVFLFVCVVASASFAADPLNVHESGFGPKIQGLQLGAPMTWPTMVATQKKIISRPRTIGPGIPPISHPAIFGMIIADNYKAANHKWTFEKFPTNLPGKWLVVSFQGISGQASLSNSGGGIMCKVPKDGNLNDLFGILRKNGLNHIAAPNIMLRDDRVLQYSVNKDELPTEASTMDDFAQWLGKTYSLGAMEQKDQSYEAGNTAEGWRAVVTEDKVQVISMPIPDGL